MRRDDPGPYSLDALKTFPVPQLFNADASAWKAALVSWFEAESGRALYPMQVEMLLIETLAYAMATLGAEGQMIAEQHLVALAGIAGLERLGPNRSTPRLRAAKARVSLTFTLAQAAASSVVVAQGSAVSAGTIVFLTLAPAVIPAGSLTAIVTAEAAVAGPQSNGLLPGQVSNLATPVAGLSVANSTTSEGGADAEAEDLYRLRLANAFERISTGGSYAWYRETAAGVSSAIADVAVVRPTPCVIHIYPLTLAGPAGATLLAQVAAAFNTADALDIRFGDDVFVLAPTVVTAAPVLTVRAKSPGATLLADATSAAQSVLKVWKESLGSIIAPSEVEAAILGLTGVVDAEVSGMAFQALEKNEFLAVTSLTVNIVEVAS